MEEIVKVFGLNWKLLLIQAVNFAVLVLVLWYFLYRPILKMLDERRAKVEQGVKDAQAAQARLLEIDNEKGEILKGATASAEEHLTASKARAQEQAHEIVTEAQQRAEAAQHSAQQRAEELKTQALKESREEIGKAAILAAEAILRDKK